MDVVEERDRFGVYILDYSEHEVAKEYLDLRASGKIPTLLDREVPEYKDLWRIDFDNGYSASVIRTPFSYGAEAGLFEMAVLKDGDLCYNTPITNDVIGWLSRDDVADILDKIRALDEFPPEGSLRRLTTGLFDEDV